MPLHPLPYGFIKRHYMIRCACQMPGQLKFIVPPPWLPSETWLRHWQLLISEKKTYRMLQKKEIYVRKSSATPAIK